MNDRPPRLVHTFLLAHHRREQAERCLQLPLGRRLRLALCARCLGLYPTLFTVLALQAATRPPGLGPLDWWLCLPGLAPALLDWGLSWLGRRRGTNAMRLATGVLLGISLGRGFFLYFHDPRSEIFWVQIGLLVAGAAAFELVRRLRP